MYYKISTDLAPDHRLGHFIFSHGWPAVAVGLSIGMSQLFGQTPDSSGLADSLDTSDGDPIIASYQLPGVTVTASRLDLAPLLEPMQRELRPLATAAESYWLATHLPGSFALSNGGPGTVQTISTGGGTSSHTAVLLDGIPLNSPQFGSLDLSTLPMTRIGRIEYLPHGGTSVGHGSALSGAVNLVSRRMKTGSTIATGDHGLRRAEASFAAAASGLAIGSQVYDGNFAYRYLDETLVRENNGSELYFLQGRAERKIGAIDFVASAWVTQSKKRISGATNFPSPRASQTDGWGIVSLSADRRTEASRQRLQLYLQNQNTIYDDPDWETHSDHTTRIAGLRYSLHRLWTPSITTLSQLEMRQETLTSTDAGDHGRYPATLLQQIEIRALKYFTLLASGRALTLDFGSWWTNSEAALSWKMPMGEPWSFDVAVITATQLRQPTFNDLYWVPGGNAQLLPERSQMTGARITLTYGRILTARLDRYTTEYEDLIAWAPGLGGVWSPENIHAARAEQTAISLDMHSPEGRLSLVVSISDLQTINKAEGANQGMRLLYKPRETSSLALSVQLGGQLTWVAQRSEHSRYITSYYYPNEFQPRAAIWNSYLAWLLSPPAMAYDFNVTLGVANLQDVAHEFILGYPEPGRAFTFTLQLQKR